MTEFANNLKRILEERNMTQSELARAAGIRQSSISDWLNSKYEPKQNSVFVVARALGVSPSSLIGIGQSIDDIIALEPSLHPIRRIRKIPILGEIACGDPIWAEENFEGYIGIDPTAMDGDFALYAKGNSMVDADIYSGDLVLLRKVPIVDDGKIAAVYYDGEATLKKIYMDRENKRTVLQPCNADYAPIIIDDDGTGNAPIILGECVGVYHPIGEKEEEK